jgi:four helix bundle protein
MLKFRTDTEMSIVGYSKSTGGTMETQNDISIRAKIEELIDSINTLTKVLPDNQVYEIGDRLRRSVCNIPKNVEELYSDGKSKMDKIKSMIHTNIALRDCKDYLNLVEVLKYAKTRDLIDKIDNVNKQIASDYPHISRYIMQN